MFFLFYGNGRRPKNKDKRWVQMGLTEIIIVSRRILHFLKQNILKIVTVLFLSWFLVYAFLSLFCFILFFCGVADIIIIIIITPWEFFTSASADGLSLESEWQQVSRTHLNILAVLNNVVVWMVSTSLIFKSSSPFNNPLLTVPRAPITIGKIVIFMFHSFFNSLARSKYLSFFSSFFNFTQPGQQSRQFQQVPFLFIIIIIIIRSGLRAEIRWYVCKSKYHRSLCVFLQDKCWVVHIPFGRMVKFEILAQLPVNHLAHPVVSSLIFLLR